MLSSHQPIFLCNEKSISDQGDQMDTPLLTIPTIVTILDIAIAGIGSGSDPLTAQLSKRSYRQRQAIMNDQNDRHISQGALQFRFISC